MRIHVHFHTHAIYANIRTPGDPIYETLLCNMYLYVHTNTCTLCSHDIYKSMNPRDPIYETPLYMCIYISTCTYIYLHVHRMYANTRTLPHTCHICIHSQPKRSNLRNPPVHVYIYIYVYIYISVRSHNICTLPHTCHICTHSNPKRSNL